MLSCTGPFSFERLCIFFLLSLLLLFLLSFPLLLPFVLPCLAALSDLVRLPLLDLRRCLSALSWLLLSEVCSEPDDEALLCLFGARLFKGGSSLELLLRPRLQVSLLGLHHATEDDSVRGCLRGLQDVLVSRFWKQPRHLDCAGEQFLGTVTLRSGRRCALPSPLPLT